MSHLISVLIRLTLVISLSSIVSFADYAKDLHNAVFKDPSDGDHYDSKQTLELLKELRTLRPKDSLYSNLIGLSENHESKCDLQSVKDFQSQLNRKSDSSSITFYKEDEWEKRCLACNDTWKGILQSSVSKLSSQDRELIDKLRESIMNSSSGGIKARYKNLEKDVFSSRIYPYFEENIRLNENSDAKNGETLFDSEYKRLVSDLCQNVLSNLKSSIEIYQWFIYEAKKNYFKKDNYIQDWLQNIEICQAVDGKSNSISRRLRKMFNEKHPEQASSGGHLFKLLNSCTSSN